MLGLSEQVCSDGLVLSSINAVLRLQFNLHIPLPVEDGGSINKSQTVPNAARSKLTHYHHLLL